MNLTRNQRFILERAAMNRALDEGWTQFLETPLGKTMRSEIAKNQLEIVQKAWIHGFTCGGDYESQRTTTSN